MPWSLRGNYGPPIPFREEGCPPLQIRLEVRRQSDMVTGVIGNLHDVYHASHKGAAWQLVQVAYEGLHASQLVLRQTQSHTLCVNFVSWVAGPSVLWDATGTPSSLHIFKATSKDSPQELPIGDPMNRKSSR